jgi:hypothetical protein
VGRRNSAWDDLLLQRGESHGGLLSLLLAFFRIRGSAEDQIGFCFVLFVWYWGLNSGPTP